MLGTGATLLTLEADLPALRLSSWTILSLLGRDKGERDLWSSTSYDPLVVQIRYEPRRPYPNNDTYHTSPTIDIGAPCPKDVRPILDTAALRHVELGLGQWALVVMRGRTRLRVPDGCESPRHVDAEPASTILDPALQDDIVMDLILQPGLLPFLSTAVVVLFKNVPHCQITTRSALLAIFRGVASLADQMPVRLDGRNGSVLGSGRHRDWI
ncbi:hypothetical protein G7054_g14788 [Neopestalotiopsis clavispora]|nr:hypothetical protein G7054_g14788 [Neopestalotiopsis clavispora]